MRDTRYSIRDQYTIPAQAARTSPDVPLLVHMRRWCRTIATAVTLAFLNLYLQPLAVAANLPSAPARASRISEDKFDSTLKAIEDDLQRLQAKVAKGENAGKERSELHELRQNLNTLDGDTRRAFDEIERQIRRQKLPQVILDRHHHAVSNYKQEMQALKDDLDGLRGARDEHNRALKVKATVERIRNEHRRRAHIPFDPKKLPFRVLKNRAKEPRQTTHELQALFPQKRLQVAALDLLPGMLVPVTLAGPTQADLSATEDVQITDDIRAMATSLNNNPVQIYNWVHDNVDFVPTYGSIQGSQMCFDTRQCNAIDTASLLIALLRAAGVPAHYVYGTVQVPINKARNWVGGVNDPQAVLQLLGQGGIPSRGLAQGGKVVAVQLEHTWVEAWVDFYPSRGSINKQPDSWVPMDPSFKQYRYTQGMNIKANVPFDATAFAAQIKASAQSNDQEGWVTGIDRDAVNAAADDYRTRVYDYINGIKSNASVGDVIGTKEIIETGSSILSAALPYRVIATGSRFASVPDNLRHKITFSLYGSELDRALDSPTIVVTRSLPSIAGKKIVLAYPPASAADQAVIDNAVASGATTFPAYLVNVRPELRIEGTAVGVGDTVTMATPQIFSVNVTTPWYAENQDYSLLAGDVSALGINPGSITSHIYAKRIKQFDLSQPGATVDEMLFQVALAYWASLQAYTGLHAGFFGTRSYHLPSHGLVSAPLSVVYRFGVPLNATYKGRNIDVKESLITAVDSNNDPDITRQFVRHTGYMSSLLESSIFDQLFQLTPGTSISAVQALAVANAQGTRIYTVTPDNLNQVLPVLNISDTAKTTIVAGVQAGRVAYVPQNTLSYNGFVGSGYIIEDPVTGAGSYKIAGGRDGGDSPAPEEVQPLPKIPASSAVLFVLGAVAQQAGASVIVDGGVLTGVAIPGVGEALIVIGIIILLYLLIKAVLQTMADTIERLYPRIREHYRHFSTDLGALLITVSGVIYGSKSGTFGPGVYMTRESFPECPPTPQQSLDIATRYELPDPSRATGYVDVIITRANFWVIDVQTNGSGGVEHIIRAPGLPLDGFGVEREGSCTALGLL